MKNKKQDVNSLEDLLKAANDFRQWAIDFGNELSKVLADIKVPKKEEDTWEMEVPYEEAEEIWLLNSYGQAQKHHWNKTTWIDGNFNQGNIFPTEEAAELEAKRRNLLTRFNAFRDECNGDWKPDWKKAYGNKYFICEIASRLEVYVSSIGNSFVTFGYFKNNEDCKRAIEIFGDEIKELFVARKVEKQYNKHFALRLKTTIHARATKIEREIETNLSDIKYKKLMKNQHPEIVVFTEPEEAELEKLYKFQKENEKK